MNNIAAHYVFTGTELIKNAYITVDKQGKIIFVSNENEALKERERTIFYNGIICPAFINMHCHLELSYLANKTKLNSGLADFIKSVSELKKSRNQNTGEDAKYADETMYNNGIQVVADVCNTPKSIEAKLSSKIFYHNFIEVYGINNDDAERIFSNANAINKDFKDAGLNSSITIHAPYSVSEKLLKMFLEQSPEFTSVHFLESSQETDIYNNSSGKLWDAMQKVYVNYQPTVNSSEKLFELVELLKNSSKTLILVHNTELQDGYFNPDERLFLCLCPSSNLNISNKLPDRSLLNENHNFVIGTDSFASVDKLCVLNEIKIIMKNYGNIKLDRILQWATYNGAKALNIEERYGQIKQNITPGILLLQNLDLQNLTINENTQIKRLY